MAAMTRGEQQKLNDRLDEMRDAAFAAQKERHDIWQDGLKYAFGDQGVGDRAKAGWDPIVHNHVFPAMMQELAMQSQRRTMILARPQESSDVEGSKVWQSHLQWIYNEEFELENFMLRAKLDGQIYGYYVAYNYWEPKAWWDDENMRWVGAERVKLVPPEFCAWDPETDQMREAESIITCRRMAKDLACVRWPKFGEHLKGVSAEDEHDWTKYYTELTTTLVDGKRDVHTLLKSQDRLVGLLQRSHRQQTTGKGKDAKASKYVNIEQYIFRDRSEMKRRQRERIPEEELLADGRIMEEPVTGAFVDTKTLKPMLPENWPTRPSTEPDVPMYPHGRIVLRAGGKILNPDRAQQRWMYRRWPFVVGANHLLPHVAWGLNAVEMPRNLQDRVNNTSMHIQNAVRLFGDPYMVIEEGTLVEGSRPSNRAGNVIRTAKNRSKGIRREPPPPINMGLFKAQQEQAADLRDQTGIQEVGLGRGGTGDQTAREVLVLQTNTRLRTALSNKLMDVFLVNVFRRIAEQAASKYTPEQIIRVVGEENADTVYRITREFLATKFDIKLEVGTTLPFDQDVEKREAMQLFGVVGVPYLKRLLEAYEVSNIEEVLKEHGEYQAFLQFQAQLEAEQAAMEQEPAETEEALPPIEEMPQ